MSDSLPPHGLQLVTLPCPSLSPGVCSDSCPLSQWCYQTISLCAYLFSFCLHSFPASRPFPVSWLFASDGQSIGASASVLPMNIQGWFTLTLTDFSLFAVQGTLESSPTPQFESINSSALSLLSGPTPTSLWDYWKNHSFDYMDLCRQSDGLKLYEVCNPRFSLEFTLPLFRFSANVKQF